MNDITDKDMELYVRTQILEKAMRLLVLDYSRTEDRRLNLSRSDLDSILNSSAQREVSRLNDFFRPLTAYSRQDTQSAAAIEANVRDLELFVHGLMRKLIEAESQKENVPVPRLASCASQVCSSLEQIISMCDRDSVSS